MLTLVLADAQLELVPADIAGHPAVREPARQAGRRPSDLLLDQNAHVHAMGRLDDAKRRGRPDIVHYTLLAALESPLAKAGQLGLAIHTRDGTLVRVRGDTRLPRGEARFQGLMAKVLREGASQEGADALLRSEGRRTPKEALALLVPAGVPVVRLDEGGEPLSPAGLVAKAKAAANPDRGADLAVVLGAFPSGAFPKAWLEAAPVAVSLWPDALNAWAVAGEVVAAFRAAWGPHWPVAADRKGPVGT